MGSSLSPVSAIHCLTYSNLTAPLRCMASPSLQTGTGFSPWYDAMSGEMHCEALIRIS